MILYPARTKDRWFQIAVGLILFLAVASPSLKAQTPLSSLGLEGLSPIRILDHTNAQFYEQIFTLQQQGDWAKADLLIKKLTDPLLMGHIKAQRLLHVAHKSSYLELVGWLKQYSNHPQAEAIYNLAVHRKPATNSTGSIPKPQFKLFKDGNPDMNMIAAVPEWKQGLQAWVNGNYPLAIKNFEKVGIKFQNVPWVASAGAFWAARGYLKIGNPQKYSEWMTIATHYPRTFYGQLAVKILGISPTVDWSHPDFSAKDVAHIQRYPSGQRALALLQVNQAALAEDELHVLRQQADAPTIEALLALSQQLNFTNLSFQTSARNQHLILNNNNLMTGLYPIPNWSPQGGFKIDPALLYAVMRQESSFNPNALSRKGASGLMQLMPDTAYHITNNRPLRNNQRELLIPEVNLSIAQDYIFQLLGNEDVRGDLILMTIAYNAGPTRVAKWKRRFSYDQDPLLFIERIPFRETRLYVQRVLTNLWIYGDRLDQNIPSLQALASGFSPVYVSQDHRVQNPQVAFKGQ